MRVERASGFWIQIPAVWGIQHDLVILKYILVAVTLNCIKKERCLKSISVPFQNLVM